MEMVQVSLLWQTEENNTPVHICPGREGQYSCLSEVKADDVHLSGTKGGPVHFCLGQRGWRTYARDGQGR